MSLPAFLLCTQLILLSGSHRTLFLEQGQPPNLPPTDVYFLFMKRLTTLTLQAYGTLLWPLRTFVLPAIDQTSAFLDLPIDILCAICDELPLSAKILLSHTCKAMWYTLRSQCAVLSKAIAGDDRSSTLIELGKLLPDNYHCTKCNLLPTVLSYDTPDLTSRFCRRHSCRTDAPTHDQLYLHPSYTISFHHVQLALKYSRMKEKHQDCRTNILRKFEIHPVGSPIIKTFTAQPKVVNAKFLLLATYVVDAASLRDAAERDHSKFIMFCPHQSFGIGLDPRSWNCFVTVLRKAAINAASTHDQPQQHTELFSCDHCPTDYSVVVAEDEAVIKVWHDLGEGLSVKDSSWQSHLYPYKIDDVCSGSQFHYEHGSISKMYDRCES